MVIFLSFSFHVFICFIFIFPRLILVRKKVIFECRYSDNIAELFISPSFCRSSLAF